MEIIKETVKEVVLAVFPIALVIVVLQFSVIHLPMDMFLLFLSGLGMVTFGLILFLLGVHSGLLPVGEMIGSSLPKTGKVWIVLLFSFILGFAITVAEPDVWVLAGYVDTASGGIIPRSSLILTVAVGLAIFVTLSMVRIITGLSINYFLIAGYIVIFAIIFHPASDAYFVPISFDAGGVTTGPMAVPFILAFGVGIASVLKSKTSSQDGFGLVALASIGPVLAVLVLGIIYDIPEDVVLEQADGGYTFLGTLGEVAIALTPLILFFIFFQFYMLKLEAAKLGRLFFGILLTWIGMTFFLHGVHVGFQPAGTEMGTILGGMPNKWIIIPIGIVLGFVATFAEPAVRVLIQEVEKVTSGSIPQKVMLLTISIGVALSIGLAMARIIYGIDLIYLVLPGYIIALTLIFFTSREFTSIAFDAGGVATGPMTVTFVVAIALGFSDKLEDSNPLIEGFGMISLVALTPILSVLILGIIYGAKDD
ncbi:Protein of unknown function (DUF1538) [Cyclonatronum proteinivorum]|uniref:DUF1538 domain-containing protein n=1 Tax=Cyclonatronum proteinivorum TaxID=1457365 RepID=A0A345UJ68_9BACT|nr:DUF1538 domain-containing protein [Cyclonatronum proteinivorum]AXJ00520.1 Protein of unknown function (DUF1538) [Cyclonatronum proteinivorum]